MRPYRFDDTLPGWCELRRFQRFAFALEDHHSGNRLHPQERLLVTKGRCQIAFGDTRQVLRAGQFLDLAETENQWIATANTADAEVLQLSGVWGADIAGCGVWTLENEPNPTDAGDPVDYPKTTRMDRHYHDYDEYWFILDGAAKAVVDDQFLDVVAGDCVAIPTGSYHDMPQVKGIMRGAFFETSLRRQRRMGHLWNHTHGNSEGPITALDEPPVHR